MAREVSLGKRPPWSRLSLPLSPPTTHGVHLAPSRLRAPTGAATCSSPAHGACALRHRDRMAPVVVAANSRGGYPRLPTEQRVTTSSCSARAQQSRESPTRCRMVAVVPMRTLLVKTRRDRGQQPMAPMDGSNGTEASDCVDVPPVRLCDLTASDGRGSSPWERRCRRCGRRRAIKTRSSRRAIARRPKHHSNSRAVERTGTLVVRAGSGAESQELSASGGARARARAQPHTHTPDTGRRSVSTEITLTYCPVCALVFRAPDDSPTRRGS